MGVAVAVQASTRARGRSAVREQLSNLQVLGPEIVSPLADAVGLVDGDQGAIEVAQQRAKAREGEALGCRVDQLVRAARRGGHAPAHLVAGEGRGQKRGGDAPLLQGLDLVLHQGDQR
jgi:hypothetical protein